MSFEEWFKQNTNDSVNENTMFSKQFVEDAYNFAKQEGKTELEKATKYFNHCCEWNDDVHDCEFRHYAIEYGSKLTKAKEIIDNLLYYIKQCTCERSNYAELDEDIKQAEQFLKETER